SKKLLELNSKLLAALSDMLYIKLVVSRKSKCLIKRYFGLLSLFHSQSFDILRVTLLWFLTCDLSPPQSLKMRCKTCALVTSSGQLTGSKRGEEIDHSECVIRMNDAPNIAHSSLQRVLRSRQELLNVSQDTVFIFWGPSSCMRRDGKGHLLPKLKVYIISRIKMLKFDELFKKETGIDRKSSNSWLSTGWFTMAIALELCDRLNVYGMVPPDFCRSSSHPSVPYHYYEPLGPDECSMYLSHERSRRGSHHRFITEKTVFAKWARTLDIHFYQPDWKPAAAVASANSSYAPATAGS
uniref:ST6 N-acetylgalactosaminide alpha-2,6-sialyltransferase 5 n=1 Tax=Lates calcarifer TaxID=8187 RepID=A0A4W6FSU2_LATCA